MEINPALLGATNMIHGWPYSDVKGGSRSAMFTQSQKQKETAVSQPLVKRFRNDRISFLITQGRLRLESNIQNFYEIIGGGSDPEKLARAKEVFKREEQPDGSVAMIWGDGIERHTAHIGLDSFTIVTSNLETGAETQVTEHMYTHEDLRIGKKFGDYVIDEYTGQIVHRKNRTRDPIKPFALSDLSWAPKSV